MRCILCVLQLPLSGCAVAPDGAPRAHRASPRAPPARRRAAALLGEMVPGEWSETEDSDAVAADFEEPQLYRTMRGDSRTRRGRPARGRRQLLAGIASGCGAVRWGADTTCCGDHRLRRKPFSVRCVRRSRGAWLPSWRARRPPSPLQQALCRTPSRPSGAATPSSRGSF